MHDGTIEKGALIKLYNCYRKQEVKTRAPDIIGMYLQTGWSGQFEFYEVAVLKDEEDKGGYVQNYLTSDFVLVPLPPAESKGIKVYGNQEEEK